MEVKINQVVLHLLDPGASEPVLSDRAMDMDADLYEYYTATLERAFASDEVKNCRFLPDSAFAAEMAQNQDFIDLSRRIADGRDRRRTDQIVDTFHIVHLSQFQCYGLPPLYLCAGRQRLFACRSTACSSSTTAPATPTTPS